MFNDIYPELFPISGDMNITQNSAIKTNRSITSVIFLLAVLGMGVSVVCLFLCIRIARKSQGPLQSNVPFKSCVVGFLFALSVTLLSMLLKAANAKWKTIFYRVVQ